MLTDLIIKNVAIIDTLQLSFQRGLTVLTGETGAGKSIIIDAIGLIMGSRASSELIRSGEEEAIVEAMFDLEGHPEISAHLAESGFPGDVELLIKRSISRAGKNRIFINGSISSLAFLADITRKLINIYGQHESQTLLRPDNQLLLLDAFGGLTALRNAYGATFRQLETARGDLARLEQNEREAARKIDLLSFQSEEIAAAALQAGEELDLEERRQLLAHAGKLGSLSSDAFERLYGGDGAVLGQLRRISSSIGEAASIDHSLSEVAVTIENAFLQLEDAAITLRNYASHVESDPAALQAVEDRLDLIGRLKKKYGPTVEDILLFKRQTDEELAGLQGLEQNRHELELACDKLGREVSTRGKELSARRLAAAGALKSALEAEIHQLAMKNAVIEAALVPLDEPRAYGMERVEFLFSPNPGEEPRPLARIASGGELSRLMLAFKQVLAESDVPTLIFDEVDTGIGGATSELVGAKLKNVAARQQVFCITHLPQVAVFADHHLRVEKHVEHGRTSTVVATLDQSGRTEEVSRMLGGTKITDTTRQHASEMLAAAAGRA